MSTEASRFNSDEFEARHAFAATEAVVRTWADVQAVEPERSFKTNWCMWCLGDLVVSEAKTSAMRLDRLDKRFASEGNEFLLLEQYSEGYAVGTSGDEYFENKPGRINLIDMSRDYRATTKGFVTRDLLIPHSAVGYDPSAHPAVSSIEADSPDGRVMTHLLSSLPLRLERINPEEAYSLSSDIADVLKSFFFASGRPEPGAVRQCRRLAIESFIEAHLIDPDLGVGRICTVFGLSRASLYRYFDGEDGIASYIRARRLNSARRDLLINTPRRGIVRDISERYGFYDSAHFNRMFKKEFAETPGDAAHSESPRTWVALRPDRLLTEWQSKLCR